MVIQAPYRWRIVITRAVVALALFMLGGLLYLVVSVAHGNTALAVALGLALIILVLAFLVAAAYFAIHGRRRKHRY